MSKRLFQNKIKGSGLAPRTVEAARLEYLAPERTLKLAGASVPALLIPYLDAAGRRTKFYRLRFLEPVSGRGKYWQPPGTPPALYLPPAPGLDWAEAAALTSVALYVTEGELKALKAVQEGFLTLGLGGVASFQSRARGLPLLPELERFAWEGRSVTLVYDSDARGNPDVGRAADALARELTMRGAQPLVLTLPDLPGLEKTGLDDYLEAEGAAALTALLEDPQRGREAYSMAGELHRLNTEVALVRNQGNPLVVELATGDKLKPDTFVRHAYADRRYWRWGGRNRDQVIEVRAAAKWVEWPGRHVLERFDFDPGSPPGLTGDGRYNLWRGFAVAPERGDVRPWLELLARQVPDPEERAHVLRWFAHLVQRPTVRINHAIVIWSHAKGTGKSGLADPVAALFGLGAGGRELQESDLMAPFNEWQDGTVFVIGNEIAGQHAWEHKTRLRNLITNNTVTVNKKNLPTFTIPNLIHYWLTSNNPDAVKMDDNERRFFVVHGAEAKLPAAAARRYFEWAESAEGRAALLDYLLRFDLEGFDPKAEPPATPARAEMARAGASGLEQWLLLLRDEPEEALGTVPGALFTVAQLFARYQLATDDRRTKEGTFRQALARVLPEPYHRRPQRKRGGRSEKFPTLYAARDREAWARRPDRAWIEHKWPAGGPTDDEGGTRR